jgi:NAD(P)-dependent dehydrogenase (short-subunit alcohol dehydrogenase family)
MSSRRVAIVTGSASGIGKAIALQLSADGFDIVLNDLPASQTLKEPRLSWMAGRTLIESLVVRVFIPRPLHCDDLEHLLAIELPVHFLYTKMIILANSCSNQVQHSHVDVADVMIFL